MNDSEKFLALKRKNIIEFLNDEEFEIYKCKSCNGTGLYGAVLLEGGFSWGGEYCEQCGHIGFKINPEDCLHDTYKLCPFCNGVGKNNKQDWGFLDYSSTCKFCNGRGFTNWLEQTLSCYGSYSK